jgi:hypothetical protein
LKLIDEEEKHHLLLLASDTISSIGTSSGLSCTHTAIHHHGLQEVKLIVRLPKGLHDNMQRCRKEMGADYMLKAKLCYYTICM